jgi:GTPase SAR1 family protein
MNLREKMKIVIVSPFKEYSEIVDAETAENFLRESFLADLEDAFTSLYLFDGHQTVSVSLPSLKNRKVEMFITRRKTGGSFIDEKLTRDLKFDPQYSCRLRIGDKDIKDFSRTDLQQILDDYSKDYYPFIIFQGAVRSNDFKWWIGNLVTQNIIGEETAAFIEQQRWKLIKILLENPQALDSTSDTSTEYFDIQAKLLEKEEMALETFYSHFGYNIQAEELDTETPVVDEQLEPVMEYGWVSKGERSSRLGHKILIAGLSEAGKTAVKRVFFMKQKAEDVDNLDATINYERMAFNISDVPVTIVDLGGQRVFIKRFLSGFSPFIFSSVKIFLFVIDVAVKSTRNNAMQYFSSCLEKLKKFSPGAKFFVFLHKNDLVRHLPNYESVHGQLIEQFQLESPEKVHFFRTTIYKPETIIKAFGRAIEIAIPNIARSKYVDGKNIGQVEEYAEKYVTTVEAESGYCPKCGSDFIARGNMLVCNFCGNEM